MITIVGGGLAGVSLAKKLMTRGIPFEIYLGSRKGASHISSGIINPITGRRYALSWQFENLKDAAVDFYGDHIKKIPIRRYFKPYKENSTIAVELKGKERYCTWNDPNWVDIHEAYQVNVRKFIQSSIESFPDTSVNEREFDCQNLLVNLDQMTIAHSIIFAEGDGVLKNPLFSGLPYFPNRGQALLLDIPEFHLTEIIQKGKFICPFEENFWIGSSFEKISDIGETTTEIMYQELTSFLPDLIGDKNWKVKDHLGAFRVTTPDRRPIIGMHPKYPSVYLFNGFGTKGVSLIPYFADQLLNHIFLRKELNPEVDIARFYTHLE